MPISKFALDADVETTVKNVRDLETKLASTTAIHDGFNAWNSLRFNEDGSLKKDGGGNVVYPTSTLSFEVNGVLYALELPTEAVKATIESVVETKKSELESLTLSAVTGK